MSEEITEVKETVKPGLSDYLRPIEEEDEAKV